MTLDDYFRGDQKKGISPPDLSKNVDFADHIVKARGKRTQFTSVSKDKRKIGGFGDQIYKLRRKRLAQGKHSLVEHDSLMTALRGTVTTRRRAERLKAIQAMRYARKWLEGLVEWRFDISEIERKDLIAWAAEKIQFYFKKV